MIGACLITAQNCPGSTGGTATPLPPATVAGQSTPTSVVLLTEEQARRVLSFPPGFFAPLPLAPDPAESGSRPINTWYDLAPIQQRFQAARVNFIQRQAFVSSGPCSSVCAVFVYVQGLANEAGAMTGLALSQEYETASPSFSGQAALSLPPGTPGYSLRLQLPVGAEAVTFGFQRHNLVIGGQVIALPGQSAAAVEVRDKVTPHVRTAIAQIAPEN